MTTIAQRTTGYRTINGTTYAVSDLVKREGNKYVAISGLCNGIADWATKPTTKAAALAKLGLEDGEETYKLAEEWEAALVHGVTGEVSETECTVEEGRYVRNVRTYLHHEYRSPVWEALVSADGKNWYRYRSHVQPFTR